MVLKSISKYIVPGGWRIKVALLGVILMSWPYTPLLLPWNYFLIILEWLLQMWNSLLFLASVLSNGLYLSVTSFLKVWSYSILCSSFVWNRETSPCESEMLNWSIYSDTITLALSLSLKARNIWMANRLCSFDTCSSTPGPHCFVFIRLICVFCTSS